MRERRTRLAGTGRRARGANVDTVVHDGNGARMTVWTVRDGMVTALREVDAPAA